MNEVRYPLGIRTVSLKKVPIQIILHGCFVTYSLQLSIATWMQSLNKHAQTSGGCFTSSNSHCSQIARWWANVSYTNNSNQNLVFIQIMNLRISIVVFSTSYSILLIVTLLEASHGYPMVDRNMYVTRIFFEFILWFMTVYAKLCRVSIV